MEQWKLNSTGDWHGGGGMGVCFRQASLKFGSDVAGNKSIECTRRTNDIYLKGQKAKVS